MTCDNARRMNQHGMRLWHSKSTPSARVTLVGGFTPQNRTTTNGTSYS